VKKIYIIILIHKHPMSPRHRMFASWSI